MTRLLFAALVAAVALIAAAPEATAQKGVPPTTVIVGGYPMASDRDILENLSQSADHTMLVSLLRSAGLAEALAGHGPFTLFAPTNAAFAALPPGLLESLREPQNKAALVALLTMQIVPGNYSAARLRLLLRSGKGETQLDTANESHLTVLANGPLNLMLKDPHGDTANVILYDAKQANGVIFVTDRVMQPEPAG